MKRLLLVTALAASLSATSHAAVTAPAAWTITLPADLQAAVVADLQNAADDAKTHNDTRHGPCWTALIGFVQSGFANPLPNKPGIFLLVQKGFDFQAQSGVPLVPTDVAQSCGPVVLDLKVSFAQFLAKIGFVVSPIKLPF
jgi:opacity protein-like surface antigen